MLVSGTASPGVSPEGQVQVSPVDISNDYVLRSTRTRHNGLVRTQHMDLCSDAGDRCMYLPFLGLDPVPTTRPFTRYLLA